MGLWVYAFRVRKTTTNLQFVGDLVTDDDTSWATDVRASMKQRDRCKGRKESLGKETDALDQDVHFDAIDLMLRPPVSCCVWGRGWFTCIEDHAVSSVNLFVICYMGDFVLSSCHYLISVISSISSLVVLNGNFFDVHVEICAWQIATYNLHKPHSHCPAFPFRQDLVFSQISISYKKCRQYKHVTCITTSCKDIINEGWVRFDVVWTPTYNKIRNRLTIIRLEQLDTT
jgi:hypothetical protein